MRINDSNATERSSEKTDHGSMRFGHIRDNVQALPLSPTGSALARTDLSPLTNGNWDIHARCSCFLHLHLLAKIG